MKQENIDEFRKEENDLYNRIMEINNNGNVSDTNKVYVRLVSDDPEKITFYRNLEMITDMYFVRENEKELFEKNHTVIGEINQDEYEEISKRFVFDILRYGNEEAKKRIINYYKITHELVELCNLLNEFNVDDKWQRRIFTEGTINFDFGTERNRDKVSLDCFDFKRFLEFIKYTHIPVDVNEMIDDLFTSWDHKKYEHLVKLFKKIDSEEKGKQKIKK